MYQDVLLAVQTVKKWADPDTAWRNVAEGIEDVAEEIQIRRLRMFDGE